MSIIKELPVRQPLKNPWDELAPVANTILLPLDYRRFTIDQFRIENEGNGVVDMILAHHGVTAAECRVFTDFNRDTKIYEYRVIRANLGLLEEIFDEDWFEPTDGERDPEFYARLREAAPYYRSFERI